MAPVPGDLAIKVGKGQQKSCGIFHTLPHEVFCCIEGVAYVTEDNQSDYRLEDIVVPLPGYDVQLPRNQGIGVVCNNTVGVVIEWVWSCHCSVCVVREEYERILNEEAVGLEQLQTKIQ